MQEMLSDINITNLKKKITLQILILRDDIVITYGLNIKKFSEVKDSGLQCWIKIAMWPTSLSNCPQWLDLVICAIVMTSKFFLFLNLNKMWLSALCIVTGSAHGVNLENVDLETLLKEEPKTESERIKSLQEGERLHLGREDGKPEFK